MLNLTESLQIILNHRKQNLSPLKILFKLFPLNLFPGLVLTKIIRAQIAEINLLQLFPGFYLFLILFLVVYFVLVKYFYLIALQFDLKVEIGAKLIKKLIAFINFKNIMFLISILIFLTTNKFLPLSLESLNSYGEKSLENLWSLSEVLNLEIFVIYIFFSFSFFPSFMLKFFSLEKDLRTFSEYWKELFFVSFLIGGVLTPTIDILTQSLLAFFAIKLYSFFFFLLKKKIACQKITNYSLY